MEDSGVLGRLGVINASKRRDVLSPLSSVTPEKTRILNIVAVEASNLMLDCF